MSPSAPRRAVLMAGGRGARLAPYTVAFPKPLMPIGDMPILEVLVRQLARQGVEEVTLAVGHLASLVMAYFGRGDRFGVEIDYSIEREPLGTAGPLRLIESLDEPFLVANGDLLTDLDFAAMTDAHSRSGSCATVGVHRRQVQVDFGVVEVDESRTVARYLEKPTHQFLVSMGVYVVEPEALELIPRDIRFDLPDLVNAMIARGVPVHSYEHEGYWLDIGRSDDYRQAQDDFERMRDRLVGT
jgi:NDP-sugar pyrophosphorylase family protein